MSRRRWQRRIKGNPISPGYGIGLVSHYLSPGHVFRIHVPDEEIGAEVQRLHLAVERSRRELALLRSRVQQKGGDETAGILDAHQMLLDDPALLDHIVALIHSSNANAEWAASQALGELRAAYGPVEDEFFRQRELDTWGLFERLQRHLVGSRGAHLVGAGIALVADTLHLALLADFDLNDLSGIVVSSGGYTSHTAIIARSYGIPVISGVPHAREVILPEQQVVLDGYQGIIYVAPSKKLVTEYESRISQQRERYQALLAKERELPAVTLDGERIILEVNVETEEEVTSVLNVGAEGIGLFRSEFLYIRERDQPLSEDRQTAIYSQLAQRLYPLPLTIRTLDIGDETLPYLSSLTAGPNSILGLRGIRLSLREPDLFRAQLCAILRASTLGNVRLVLPMVSSLDEVRDARRVLAEVQEGLRQRACPFDPDLKVGIMMEVPAAFLNAAALARESDFFSIGTNDLIQYVLAVDRTNEEIAGLYDPLHPAVLRCLDEALQVAARHRIPLRVCGEMASDPIFAMLLVGMGVRNLSMNPTAVPYMRRLVRSVERGKLSVLVQHILGLSSPREIHDYVRENLQPLVPSGLQEAMSQP